MRTDRIAAITMVYGDDYLETWIAQHAALVGRENLYVVSHGPSEVHSRLCAGMNHIILPRVFDADFEAARMRLVGNIANGLLEVYRWVIFTDTDEILALDPAVGTDLPDYLRSLDVPVVAPLALGIAPADPEIPIDWAAPLLRQAPVATYEPPICKPWIRSAVIEPHLANSHVCPIPFEVDPNLLLFHLKLLNPNAPKRYAGLAEQMSAFTANWGRHWSDGTLFSTRPGQMRAGARTEMTPAAASEGARRVVDVGPAHGRRPRYRVAADQRTPPFLLPEAYRDLF